MQLHNSEQSLDSIELPFLIVRKNSHYMALLPYLRKPQIECFTYKVEINKWLRHVYLGLDVLQKTVTTQV